MHHILYKLYIPGLAIVNPTCLHRKKIAFAFVIVFCRVEVEVGIVAKGLGVNGEQTGESEDWRAGDRNENNAERMR